MLDLRFTNQFKKDLKLAKKQGKDTDKLFEVIEKLANGEPLEAKYRDHDLTGNYKGCRECHIEPDWLLVYEVMGDMSIDDCFEEIDFVRPEDFSCEYSTMGGWAIEMLEADPHVGDSFRYENLFVIVANMDEERVTKLTVLVEPKQDEEETID